MSKKKIKIGAKKFNKGDIVRLKLECSKYEWYTDIEWELYDYAYMQMEEESSFNTLDTLERDYFNDNMNYNVVEFLGWIILLRSVQVEYFGIEFKCFHEDFIELSNKKSNRHHKINQIIFDENN